MPQQTTPDGITVEQIDTARDVLETLEEHFSEEAISVFEEKCRETKALLTLYEQNASWHKYTDLPSVGDIVRDPESNERFGNGQVCVMEVTNTPAKNYRIEECDNKSVAYLNPDHPADAPVITGMYVEGSDKKYAFPCTRLEW